MRVLFVIALAAGSMACAAREPAGPAWPRAAERDGDGGESLAPRAAARAIAAVVDDHAAERAADKPAVSTPAVSAPAASSGTLQVTEEPLPLDELVIEVDD
jgi:hypothetical protein